MNEEYLKGLRYGIYARKSTESEERQVQSIEDQIKVMRKIAKQQGLNVIEEAVISEAKSAKIPDQREKFDKFVKLIESGKINGALTWKSNRMARNPKESGLIQQLLIDEKLGAIVTDGKVYLPEDNAIIFSVDSSMDTQFSRDLVKVVKRGMLLKAEKGWLPGIPPIGYTNDRINKTIVKDKTRYKLVRKLWDMMLSGTYSVRDITEYAEDINLKTMKRKKRGNKHLSYSSIYSMFHNKFYMGLLPYNKLEFAGKHEPMVTAEEFERVQRMFHPNAPRPKQDYIFMFRGLLKCGECGCAVVAQHTIKKQTNGTVREYDYYRCSLKKRDYICNQKSYLREEEISRQIKDRLERVTISPRFYELSIKALQETNDSKIATQEKVAQSQYDGITAKESELRELGRMRYRGECPDDEFYTSEKKKLEKELKDLKKARAYAEANTVNWRLEADETFSFARYAKEDFDSDVLENKRKVLVRMGQNLAVLDGEVQFTSMKYFEPIERSYPALAAEMEEVRNSPEQIRNEVESRVISSWCTR